MSVKINYSSTLSFTSGMGRCYFYSPLETGNNVASLCYLYCCSAYFFILYLWVCLKGRQWSILATGCQGCAVLLLLEGADNWYQ